MDCTGLDKPFIGISAAAIQPAEELTFSQALNRTVLDLWKLGRIFCHTKSVKGMEKADAKRPRIARSLDLESNLCNIGQVNYSGRARCYILSYDPGPVCCIKSSFCSTFPTSARTVIRNGISNT